MKKDEAPAVNDWLPALLDKPNEGINEKMKSEIIRLLRICLKHLSKGNSKDLNMYIVGIKMKMAWLANFFCEASIDEELNLDKAKLIKNFEDIENLFRSVSGLSALNIWLNSQKNGQQILRESGRQDIFERLWNLKIRKESIIFDELKSLKEKVKDLQVWLKIVKFLISRNQGFDRSTLAVATEKGIIWSRPKIMISLLISNTLDIGIKDFSLAEINNFLKIVSKDFDAWLKDFNEKMTGFSDDSGAREILRDEDLKNLLTYLSKPENQTVLDITDKLNLKKEDRHLVKELKLIFDGAVKEKFRSSHNYIDDQKQLEMATKKVGSLLRNLTPKETLRFFQEKPYLIHWSDQSSQVKVIIEDQSEWIKTLPELLQKEFTEVNKLLKESLNLKSFIYSFWNNSKVAGIDQELIGQKWPTYRMTNKGSHQREKRIILEVSSIISLDIFNDYLKDIETLGYKIDETVLKPSTALAILFYEPRPSSSIMQIIGKQTWQVYVDERLKRKFDAMLIRRAEYGKAKNKKFA